MCCGNIVDWKHIFLVHTFLNFSLLSYLPSSPPILGPLLIFIYADRYMFTYVKQY